MSGWRYYRLAVLALAAVAITHIICRAVVMKAEIDQLWREQEEAEVPLWAQQSDGLVI